MVLDFELIGRHCVVDVALLEQKMGPTAAEDEAGGGPQRDKKNHNNTSGGESTPPISTMFYIHGGAFLFGSGNVYLPDYLLDEEDVILITMNYRSGFSHCLSIILLVMLHVTHP